MNPPAQSPADRGARQAREYLQLLEDGRTDAAEELLASLSDPRELVFLGAGLTVPARRRLLELPSAG